MSLDTPSAALASQDDDLHLLMAIAVLSGQRGVEAQLLPVFDAWGRAWPGDALSGIGRGLHLLNQGDAEGAFAAIRHAATTATTRADQARDILESLSADLPQYAG